MDKRMGKVLIVDDDEDVLQAARLYLKQHVEIVHTETNPQALPNLLQNESYDAILLDLNFTRDSTSGQEGFFWLSKILEIDPSMVVILITAYGDVDMAVRAVKEGATDFILKPWQNEKLLATVTMALSLRKSRFEIAHLRSRQKQLVADMGQLHGEFIGNSPSMRQVFQAIEKVGPTDANVLIIGENGTGKELVARALHQCSPRRDEVFIGVDMGAVSESLFESELFGNVKGAYTDAKSDRPGRFELASGGTLFLDEIGNLPMPMQAKILRALEARCVMRLGSNRPIPIDIRLICATNMPIREMVGRGEFRQDLLYRVNTVEIHIPPLRERQEDIIALADHFLKEYGRKYQKGEKAINLSAMRKLQQYGWPGNVRELRHAIERAVILGETQVLQPEDFLFPLAMDGRSELSFDNYNLEDVEKTVIRKVIDKHRGNISHASKELGLTRAALYRRMAKYGL